LHVFEDVFQAENGFAVCLFLTGIAKNIFNTNHRETEMVYTRFKRNNINKAIRADPEKSVLMKRRFWTCYEYKKTEPTGKVKLLKEMNEHFRSKSKSGYSSILA